jgi:NAD(P)-dependent dehydrogenase (short-subunit alcohol dehydrogenase family)
MRFDGKTALVTGGAAGIGAATVLKFAEEGAYVISVDKDVKNGRRIISQVHERGGSGFFLEADLADNASIESCANAVKAQIPALHALVNNAGIVRYGPIEDLDLEHWDLQVPINLLAPVFITRALLPLMKQEGGAIVNISSEGAFRPHPKRWVYDVTKAGICALTRTMAAEFFAYGIRVNTVAPGWTVTEMHFAEAPDPAARKAELEQMEDERICILRRLGRPEEIANAIAFLASDEASYITATTLHVDGGLVAH